MTANVSERPMSDANLHREASTPVTNGHRGGGQLDQKFPNKLCTWIDTDLAKAISLASSIEREREAVIVRRALRFGLRQFGYYNPEAIANGR